MIKTTVVMTLTSPLAHGAPEVETEEKRSNITELRRIPFVIPGGNIVNIPAVSGNSIRGSKRRVQGYKMLEELTEYNLPLETIYFILAGGSTSNNSAKAVGQNVYAEIRQKIPFIDLFGGSYKGHFFGGRLGVGFGIPITKETLGWYGEAVAKAGLADDPDAYPNILDLNASVNSEIIMYARHALEGMRGMVDENDESSSGQMIYGTQVIPAGTVLASDITLKDPLASHLTESCYYAFLDTLLSDGYIGASFAKGCGEFVAKVIIDGQEMSAEEIKSRSSEFWDSVKANKDNIGELLSSLDSVLQNEPGKSKRQKQAAMEETEEE